MVEVVEMMFLVSYNLFKTGPVEFKSDGRRFVCDEENLIPTMEEHIAEYKEDGWGVSIGMLFQVTDEGLKAYKFKETANA